MLQSFFFLFFIKQMVPTVSKTFFYFFNRLLALKQLFKKPLLIFLYDNFVNYDFSSNH